MEGGWGCAWQPQAVEPTPCGTLELLQGRVCRFSYDPHWLRHAAAFALAPDLPLLTGSFNPPPGCDLHPIFEDAGPDRWGRAVINKVFHPSRRSPLDYLALAGENRIGALGFSATRESFQAERQQVYETADLPALRDAANALAAQLPISPAMLRLLQPGSGAGGARPKAIVRHRDADWIAKFPDREDQVDVAAIEHASLRLASLCGITVATS
jgi:serine/threonine-protein kinase HipA